MFIVLDLRCDRGGAGARSAAHQEQDQDRLRQGAEGSFVREMDQDPFDPYWFAS